jgi:hypothetical protein
VEVPRHDEWVVEIREMSWMSVMVVVSAVVEVD